MDRDKTIFLEGVCQGSSWAHIIVAVAVGPLGVGSLEGMLRVWITLGLLILALVSAYMEWRLHRLNNPHPQSNEG